MNMEHYIKEEKIYVLKDDGQFPNNEKLPLIVYEGAVTAKEGDLASEIEKLFSNNGWTNSWRNGVFEYPHYRSITHEVLGVYRGKIKIQLGGPSGVVLTLREGDVVIIPAGVAHKNCGASTDFACIGAYPDGKTYDIKYGKAGERLEADNNIKKVPLPDTDPVLGKEGPLLKYWKK